MKNSNSSIREKKKKNNKMNNEEQQKQPDKTETMLERMVIRQQQALSANTTITYKNKNKNTAAANDGNELLAKLMEATNAAAAVNRQSNQKVLPPFQEHHHLTATLDAAQRKRKRPASLLPKDCDGGIPFGGGDVGCVDPMQDYGNYNKAINAKLSPLQVPHEHPFNEFLIRKHEQSDHNPVLKPKIAITKNSTSSSIKYQDKTKLDGLAPQLSYQSITMPPLLNKTMPQPSPSPFELPAINKQQDTGVKSIAGSDNTCSANTINNTILQQEQNKLGLNHHYNQLTKKNDKKKHVQAITAAAYANENVGIINLRKETQQEEQQPLQKLTLPALKIISKTSPKKVIHKQQQPTKQLNQHVHTKASINVNKKLNYPLKYKKPPQSRSEPQEQHLVHGKLKQHEAEQKDTAFLNSSPSESAASFSQNTTTNQEHLRRSHPHSSNEQSVLGVYRAPILTRADRERTTTTCAIFPYMSAHVIGGLRDQILPRTKQCNCRRSHCLKLYCECFACGVHCTKGVCNCVGCKNNNDAVVGINDERRSNEEERRRAVLATLERNPHAFRPRMFGHYQQQQQQSITNPAATAATDVQFRSVSSLATTGSHIKELPDGNDSGGTNKENTLLTLLSSHFQTTVPNSIENKNYALGTNPTVPHHETNYNIIAKSKSHTPTRASSSNLSTAPSSNESPTRAQSRLSFATSLPIKSASPNKKITNVTIANTSTTTNATTNASNSHRGCNCRKSFCLKKYCECFQALMYCNSLICKCTDCQNVEGNLQRDAIVEKMVMKQQQQKKQPGSGGRSNSGEKGGAHFHSQSPVSAGGGGSMIPIMKDGSIAGGNNGNVMMMMMNPFLPPSSFTIPFQFIDTATTTATAAPDGVETVSCVAITQKLPPGVLSFDTFSSSKSAAPVDASFITNRTTTTSNLESSMSANIKLEAQQPPKMTNNKASTKQQKQECKKESENDNFGSKNRRDIEPQGQKQQQGTDPKKDHVDINENDDVYDDDDSINLQATLLRQEWKQRANITSFLLQSMLDRSSRRCKDAIVDVVAVGNGKENIVATTDDNDDAMNQEHQAKGDDKSNIKTGKEETEEMNSILDRLSGELQQDVAGLVATTEHNWKCRIANKNNQDDSNKTKMTRKPEQKKQQTKIPFLEENKSDDKNNGDPLLLSLLCQEQLISKYLQQEEEIAGDESFSPSLTSGILAKEEEQQCRTKSSTATVSSFAVAAATAEISKKLLTPAATKPTPNLVDGPSDAVSSYSYQKVNTSIALDNDDDNSCIYSDDQNNEESDSISSCNSKLSCTVGAEKASAAPFSAKQELQMMLEMDSNLLSELVIIVRQYAITLAEHRRQQKL